MVPSEWITAALGSFTLIGLAEIGDKSQLVCMVLASRHRAWPVILGAATAFLLLNTLAVAFGASMAAWLPDTVVAIAVALLFAGFGIQFLRSAEPEDPPEVSDLPGHGIFFTTLSLIFLAEFGDKTQIAVAGLASDLALVPVWIGATTALVMTSALGVWFGRTILKRMPTHWLHRAGGTAFLIFAGFAAWRAFA